MFRFLLLVVSSLSFGLELGKIPPLVHLEKDSGYFTGEPWNSKSKGIVTFISYVDPDVKDLNFETREALQKLSEQGYSFASIGIINMQASWVPSFAVNEEIKKEQKIYPKVNYVKDMSQILLKKWDLKDDDDNLLLFNKKGELLFIHTGKLEKESLQRLLSLITKHQES